MGGWRELKIPKFRRAKEGDAVGGNVLTAKGAEQLNQHRRGVEKGDKPSTGELLEMRIFDLGTQTKNGVGADEIKLAAKLREQDKEIYPDRDPWTLVDVGGYLLDQAKKEG